VPAVGVCATSAAIATAPVSEPASTSGRAGPSMPDTASVRSAASRATTSAAATSGPGSTRTPLRTRALETLSRHGIPSMIGAEANQLAGVHAAVRAGLGVALMATLGQTPEGLVARDDLPPPAALELAVWARQGLAAEVIGRTATALRRLLAAPPTAGDLALAEGA
jgi:hypothetical protein